MKLVLLSFILLLGCTNQVPVKVPVREVVYCAELPAKPPFASTRLKKELPVKQKVALILMDHEQRLAYEAELEAIILGCAEPKNLVQNKPNSSVVE